MSHQLKFTVLTDNIACGELEGEWGLAIYIEYDGRKILLDTGSTDLFMENAKKLGIHLDEVDFAVLSHAHYDHANGIPGFFRVNQTAKLYLSRQCRENCYSEKPEIGIRYIGIPKDTLDFYPDRLVFTEGRTEITEGITLLEHTTPGLAEIGKREKLFVKINGELIPDDFRHEHSLIFETEQGLVVFNSCSHAGAPTIVREVSAAFPDRRIIGLIGGFHLFRRSDEEVHAFARQVKECGIEYICTGHCTGENAYRILAEELGDTAEQLHCGLVKMWK